MNLLRPETTRTAREIMTRYCERTGLVGDAPPRRYLWTDAFAVCNLLECSHCTGEELWRDRAQLLVEQVHRTLGRHRPDDPRGGWISGLDEEEGRAHPTRGGLRIGKPYPERAPDEPLEERLEWDRDGQYFHYSTRWMHALARLARETGEPRYLAWAVELAQVTQEAFTWVPRASARPRMYWKMSVDLSRPLVPSMGHHDPLDGWLTFLELRASLSERGAALDVPDLAAESAVLKSMCVGVDWTTTDPLGLGGLLGDAGRLAQLRARGDVDEAATLAVLLHAAAGGLLAWAASAGRLGPASERLAFRELGLSIGLQAVPRIRALQGDGRGPFAEPIASLLDRLEEFVPWVERIEAFWLDPEHQSAPTWTAHLDINEVMLAASLAPASYLSL